MVSVLLLPHTPAERSDEYPAVLAGSISELAVSV
jgi:hypothetical protein